MEFQEGIQSLDPVALAPSVLSQVIESMAQIHTWCILQDRTMATFLPPLSADGMVSHWTNLVNEVKAGTRLILVYVSATSSRTPSTPPTITDPKYPRYPNIWHQDGLEISGMVSLSYPVSQTGPFRGFVQKLFIHGQYRRQGLARQLMAELEMRALRLGRWSLVLDTTVGTPAEHLYPSLGWTKLYAIPDYGYRPGPGETNEEKEMILSDEVFFWKDLRGIQDK